MAFNALSIYAGATAAQRLREQGWQADLFELLIGASGGPKWFILSHLDRLLFGDFLLKRQQPLKALGSSIGTWRHACLASADPVAAVARLERGYLYQHYTSKPGPEEISAVSLDILREVLGSDGAQQVVTNPLVHSHIVTARARGPAGSRNAALLAPAMGAAALGNIARRDSLRHSFQRVIFHSEAGAGIEHWPDFNTHFSPLQIDSVIPALHASGAIPFVLTGERDIPGAPAGQYWDGGILDYHFDLERRKTSGLMLYPHFSAQVIPGWFDKFLPWRRTGVPAIDNLVLLCPREDFIADLPLGKIPDRNDFRRLQHEERVRYWEQCVARSAALAEDFNALLQQSDPLKGVTLLPPQAQLARR